MKWILFQTLSVLSCKGSIVALRLPKKNPLEPSRTEVDR